MKNKILHIILLISIPFLSVSQEIKIPTNYFKAQYLYGNGNSDSALIQLDLCKDDPQCVLFKADIEFNNGNFSVSAELYKSLLEILPSESCFGLAKLYAEMGFADESVEWLERHFSYRNPKSYSEIISEASFNSINNTAEWREFWDISRYPKDIEKLNEAKYLISCDKESEALSILQQDDFGSRNYIKNRLLAEIYLKSKDLNIAANQIEYALDAKENDVESLRLKYQIYYSKSNFEVCYNAELQLLETDSYRADNLYNFAEICMLTGRKQEALKHINIFLDCFPTNENALFLKVRILSEDEDFRNALIELNKLILINPAKNEYFVLRGEIYYTFESWKFASDDFSMALDISPTQGEVYYKMGVCFHNLNNPEKACHSWQKAANMKNREAAEMLFKYCRN